MSVATAKNENKNKNKNKFKTAFVLILAVVIFSISLVNVISSGLEASAPRSEVTLRKNDLDGDDEDYFRRLSAGPNGFNIQPRPEALRRALQRQQQQEEELQQRQRQRQQDGYEGVFYGNDYDNNNNNSNVVHRNAFARRTLKNVYEYEFYGPFPSNIPYKDRWHHRFGRAFERNGVGGMLFFRHIRKVCFSLAFVSFFFIGSLVHLSIFIWNDSSFSLTFLLFAPSCQTFYFLSKNKSIANTHDNHTSILQQHYNNTTTLQQHNNNNTTTTQQQN